MGSDSAVDFDSSYSMSVFLSMMGADKVVRCTTNATRREQWRFSDDRIEANLKLLLVDIVGCK